MKITDIHTHGIDGHDTRTTSAEHILKIAEIHGASGVSDILLTVYPAAVREMREHMETIRKAVEIQRLSIISHHPGSKNHPISAKKTTEGSISGGNRTATIAGVNLEGPFLNPVRCGSLNAHACIKPSEYVLKELTEGFEDIIKIITVAPEMPGALNLIRELSDMGIAINMGHSDATYAEAAEGFRAGAKGITHLFNAMRGFHHREPGIAGFGLLNQDIYVEIIADPFHLHHHVIDMIFKIKNPEKIIIISDTVKETRTGCGNSGVRDKDGKLLGGSLVVTEAAEKLIQQGFERDIIMKYITGNPQAYLSHLHE